MAKSQHQALAHNVTEEMMSYVEALMIASNIPAGAYDSHLKGSLMEHDKALNLSRR